jgi:hypothetical protein
MTEPPPPHPRDAAIRAAVDELLPFVADWKGRHGLSPYEFLFILHTLSSKTVQALCLAEREQVAPTPPGSPGT